MARYAPTSPTLDEITRVALAGLGPGEAGWLVGGCLRDELLARRIRDIDIVVDGRQEALARALADRVRGDVYATSDVFGGWRVLAGDLRIDVAGLRGGPPGGPPDPETRARRLEADLRARDFTVDALARPLDGHDMVDPLGGLSDLAAGRLRLCSPASLDDDPLRVLRLSRLARELDLVPDATATEAAFRAAPSLARVSGERVRDELCALLATRAASVALRDLAVWGALAVVLPEVDQLRGVEQNPYHHRDVFEHTTEALTYVVGVVAQLGGRQFLTTPEEAGLPGVGPLVPVSWAVLLHDIGKPLVRVVDDRGRVIFWHHDEAGRRMCAGIGRRLKLSNRFVEYVGTLVRQHLRLGFLTHEQPLTRRALARYRRDVHPWVFESVVVSLCDRLATRGEKTSLSSMARHYRLARTVWTEVSKAPTPRVLTGDDVMDLLGIGPGPDVGRALDALDEEVEAGEVTDADGARAFLRRWWAARDDA
ncbi:MAG: Multifunctional CCA protein [Actinobacteria bacterium ADurb.BinA094]|nr:MAG: Multifunctional CCA protein [Actinobacteria bacterium ADurb.BinA094]